MKSTLFSFFALLPLACARKNGWQRVESVKITSTTQNLNLGVENGSQKAGAKIVLAPQAGLDQRWIFNGNMDYLSNGNTRDQRLVLTAPVDDKGKIIPGAPLKQDLAYDNPGNSNQKWIYRNQAFMTTLDQELCMMATQDGDVVMDKCGDDQDQFWYMTPFRV